MRLSVSLSLMLCLASPVAAQMSAPTVAPGRDPAEVAKVEKIAANLANELSRACPYASASSEKDFNACRERLFDDSLFRSQLSEIVLWGRQRDPKARIAETNLTQFGPDVLTGMYVSLFMFNGKYSVQFLEREGLYRVDLGATFRNRMAPGQFPYPFWHEEDKWVMYQDANHILLYVDPKTTKIRVAQFSPHGAPDPAVKVDKIATPTFDGKWLWTDSNGKTQPQITLFDGLFSADNPHLKQVEASYKDFALSLREGTCASCHVPSNPAKSKKLVLLHSPAHAAGEIKRTIASVERDRMPFDDFGIEKPLSAEVKNPLLDRARAFDKVVDLAKSWEKDNGRMTLTGSVRQ